MIWSDQGGHYREKSGRTGNFVKKNPCREKSGNLEKMGKIREKSGNFTKTCQGNIRECSAIYIYILIVSPFSRIYIYILYIYPENGETIREKSEENQGICFTKLSGHPVGYIGLNIHCIPAGCPKPAGLKQELCLTGSIRSN